MNFNLGANLGLSMWGSLVANLGRSPWKRPMVAVWTSLSESAAHGQFWQLILGASLVADLGR